MAQYEKDFSLKLCQTLDNKLILLPKEMRQLFLHDPAFAPEWRELKRFPQDVECHFGGCTWRGECICCEGGGNIVTEEARRRCCGTNSKRVAKGHA